MVGALAAAGVTSRAGPRSGRRNSPTPGSRCCARTGGQEPEIWCRCDGGPHGYLSIAAHAHADALSVEVRCGGVDVLADPGTYCYHGEPAWRSYFRSTIAHNTVELAGRNQSSEGGPFLWLRHADAQEIDVRDDGETVSWTAEHDGYQALDPPARHRRKVRLDRAARSMEIIDEITAAATTSGVAFHLGPDIEAELDGAIARPALARPPAGGRRGWNCPPRRGAIAQLVERPIDNREVRVQFPLAR